MHQYLLIFTCSLKREVLRIGDYLGKNIAFPVYKALICRKSMQAIEKIKMSSLQKFLRILPVFVLFEYHAFLLKYLVGTEKIKFVF